MAEHSALDFAAQKLRQHARVVAVIEAGVRPREFIQQNVDGPLPDGDAKQNAPALIAGQLPTGWVDRLRVGRRSVLPGRAGSGRRGSTQRSSAVPSVRPSEFPRLSREPGWFPAGCRRRPRPKTEAGLVSVSLESREDEVLSEGLGQASGRRGHDDQRIAAGEPSRGGPASSPGPCPRPWETMEPLPIVRTQLPGGLSELLRRFPDGNLQKPNRNADPIRPAKHARCASGAVVARTAGQRRSVGDTKPASAERQDDDAQCQDRQQDPPGPRGFTQGRGPPG